MVFAVTVIEFVVDIAVVVAVAEVIVVVVVVAVNVDWPCLIHLTTSNLQVSCHGPCCHLCLSRLTSPSTA